VLLILSSKICGDDNLGRTREQPLPIDDGDCDTLVPATSLVLEPEATSLGGYGGSRHQPLGPQSSSCPCVVMAGLSELDFSHGRTLHDQVKERFVVPIYPFSASSVFHLVVSFSRSAIMIDSSFVSLILQYCLGGVAEDFNVVWLHDWYFHFSVSCKNVGLMIHYLKSFVCTHFTVCFTLWRNGGPDWVREFSRWQTLKASE
jgi:hypothetical protein